jgi:hypothetical protein
MMGIRKGVKMKSMGGKQVIPDYMCDRCCAYTTDPLSMRFQVQTELSHNANLELISLLYVQLYPYHNYRSYADVSLIV